MADDDDSDRVIPWTAFASSRSKTAGSASSKRHGLFDSCHRWDSDVWLNLLLDFLLYKYQGKHWECDFSKVHAIWLYKDHPYKDQY